MQNPSFARRETNLVVRATRAFLSGGDHGDLQDALAQPFDWTAAERSAKYHSLMPVFAYSLKEYGGSLVAAETRERFQQQLRLTARKNMAWLMEWHRILLAFEAEGIPVISLKGPGFALQAYQNIALREFADLDLLIEQKNVSQARHVLFQDGYQLRFLQAGNGDSMLFRSGNCQLEFFNAERGTVIDLHWSALHEMFSFQLPAEQLFRTAQVKHHEGISFLSLSPEFLLLYLCAHGTKHCWFHLRWLCDVASHVQTAEELDWNLCIRCADQANCALVLRHSLLLAEEVLKLELPEHVKKYCDDEKARALADTASSFLFSEGNNPGYGTALRYYLAFSKGWRAYAHLVLKRVFTPEEQEWQAVRLPRPLHFLYYAVRPARFMFEQLSRATLRSR